MRSRYLGDPKHYHSLGLLLVANEGIASFAFVVHQGNPSGNTARRSSIASATELGGRRDVSSKHQIVANRKGWSFD